MNGNIIISIRACEKQKNDCSVKTMRFYVVFCFSSLLLMEILLFLHRKCNKLLYTHFQWGEGAREHLCCSTALLFLILSDILANVFIVIWAGVVRRFVLIVEECKAENIQRETNQSNRGVIAHVLLMFPAHFSSYQPRRGDTGCETHLGVPQHDHPYQDHVDVDSQRLIMVNLVHLKSKWRPINGSVDSSSSSLNVCFLEGCGDMTWDYYSPFYCYIQGIKLQRPITVMTSTALILL